MNIDKLLIRENGYLLVIYLLGILMISRLTPEVIVITYIFSSFFLTIYLIIYFGNFLNPEEANSYNQTDYIRGLPKLYGIFGVIVTTVSITYTIFTEIIPITLRNYEILVIYFVQIVIVLVIFLFSDIKWTENILPLHLVLMLQYILLLLSITGGNDCCSTIPEQSLIRGQPLFTAIIFFSIFGLLSEDMQDDTSRQVDYELYPQHTK